MADFNLMQFCGASNDIREWLREPFLFKGNVVATNGHMAVFTSYLSPGHYDKICSANYVNPNEPLKTCAADQPTKDRLANLISEAIEVTYTQDFIKPEYSPKKRCFVCRGRMVIQPNLCPECGGRQQVEAKSSYGMEYTVTCKTCSSASGNVYNHDTEMCIQCAGTGMAFPQNEKAKVLGVYLNPKYYELITGLGDVSFGRTEKPHCLYFKSGLLHGSVMGLRD